MKDDNKYGLGKNPPYSLYQAEDGKWGLIDKDGRRLDAVFNRPDDKNLFSCVPWEVVEFDEKEGFEIVAWYDPFETWFAFTFDDDAYPDRWGGLLWKSKKKEFRDCMPLYLDMLPEQSHWLVETIDHILSNEKKIQIQYKDDLDKEDAETEAMLRDVLTRYPALSDYAATGLLLAPILDNPEISDEDKSVLWREKVYIDSLLRDLAAAE